jgi:DNA (cytosine-5)-methyltransferase 1
MNYYNEFDLGAAAWLRQLIARGLIPAGDVDTRSITEIKPHELTHYTQCHFFAGIGGWSYALELAGWEPSRKVWTGSCPCQPFSSVGNHRAQADERHLWPVFFNLIRECRPDTVFGEQVADAVGVGWLDGVSSDLERAGYACGAAVLGAHSVGSPHIRQRLYWVGDSQHAGLEGHGGAEDARNRPGRLCAGADRPSTAPSISAHWDDHETAYFAGGEARRIQRGTLPLADGVPSRVVKLRGYGNAIVPQVAAQFITAYLQST